MIGATVDDAHAEALARDWIDTFLRWGRADRRRFGDAIDWEQAAVYGLVLAVRGFRPRPDLRTFSVEYARRCYRTGSKAERRRRRRWSGRLARLSPEHDREDARLDGTLAGVDSADSARVALGRVADAIARLYLIAEAYDELTPAAIGRANGTTPRGVRQRVARAVG